MTMKRFALLTLLLGLVASPVFAQSRGGMRHYDPKTETTVRGTITEVQQPAGMRGG
jgi:predicted S18 family serine protease